MHYNRINLMCPTYGRSKDLLPSFIASAYDNADSSICFTFCVNEKDKKTLSFLLEREWPEDFKYDVIFENSVEPNLSQYFNLMYDKAEFNDDSTLVTMLGDDMIFETPGYDRIILDKVNKRDGVGVFWCDDAYIGRDKFPVNLFLSRKFVRATGMPFMCPYYKADMIDAVWYEIGRRTGTLNYIPEVIIRHEHSSKKTKEEWDKTFKRLRPLQDDANKTEHQRAGMVYAALASGNLVRSGLVRDFVCV